MYGDGKGVRGMRVGEGEIKRVYRKDMGGRLRLYWQQVYTVGTWGGGGAEAPHPPDFETY